ncbi:hypothetical protein BC937DRAFT_88551, partial [Endogone sp. FLAS-F59071]
MNRTDTETVDKLAEEVKSLTKTLRSGDPGSEDYSELKEIRQEIAAKRLKVINLEKALVRAKSSLNIALRAKHTTVAAATNAVTDISAIEDKIELMGRKVVFAGMDPSIVTTSTTIPRTLEEVFADINCFHILSAEDSSNVETTLYSDGVQQLPRPSKITTCLIDNATFKRCHQKKHQRMEASGRSPHQAGIQQDHGTRAETYPRTRATFPGEKTPAIIHCIGHWQGINSNIKGHSRRGVKKIGEQHCIYGHVGITNEYNTSKTCPYCFSKIVLYRVRRVIEGCTLKRRNRMCQPSVPLKDDK